MASGGDGPGFESQSNHGIFKNFVELQALANVRVWTTSRESKNQASGQSIIKYYNYIIYGFHWTGYNGGWARRARLSPTHAQFRENKNFNIAMTCRVRPKGLDMLLFTWVREGWHPTEDIVG